MLMTDFIAGMPKVELHVHLEGSVRPATLRQLAQSHRLSLPGLALPDDDQHYHFHDFAHFVAVYDLVSMCIRTTDDLELITREFLTTQAEQRITYSEVIYTPYTHYRKKGLAFADQLAAILRARRWAEANLGVTLRLILDFARKAPLEEAETVAEWAIGAMGDGVVGLGIGGVEAGHPAAKFRAVFARVREAGLACVPHAGETAGAASMWEAITELHAARIGHGIRCLEDARLVGFLREHQIPLDVCPTSNVRTGVVSSLSAHPLPELLRAGLVVTMNSDDPPLFGTTLTAEYQQVATAFNLGSTAIEQLVKNAVGAALLPAPEREQLLETCDHAFVELRERLKSAERLSET